MSEFKKSFPARKKIALDNRKLTLTTKCPTAEDESAKQKKDTNIWPKDTGDITGKRDLTSGGEVCTFEIDF